MKALVAQKLSGPSGLAYTDVDEVVGNDDVVDPIGGETFDEAVRALAVEGRLLVIGVAQSVKAGSSAAAADALPAVQGRRGAADPGRRRGAGQAGAGAVMSACAKNIER